MIATVLCSQLPQARCIRLVKLDKNPFIITAVVGQELLSTGHTQAAMKVLEAARAIGTDSLKLEASLLQALGRVHWSLKNTDKALAYMEEDLKINVAEGPGFNSEHYWPFSTLPFNNLTTS